MAVGDKKKETMNQVNDNGSGSAPQNHSPKDETDDKSFIEDVKNAETEINKDEEIKIEIEDAAAEEQSSTEKKAEDANLKLANEYFDQLQRLQAEFMNYKKRMERERENLNRYIKVEIIRKLLPVIDDFERFLASHQREIKESGGLNGIQLVFEKLSQILKDEGLEALSALGQSFDPNFHEALFMQETDEEQDGKVLEVWEKGYFLGEWLLRPAKVKVGKKK